MFLITVEIQTVERLLSHAKDNVSYVVKACDQWFLNEKTANVSRASNSG